MSWLFDYLCENHFEYSMKQCELHVQHKDNICAEKKKKEMQSNDYSPEPTEWGWREFFKLKKAKKKTTAKTGHWTNLLSVTLKVKPSYFWQLAEACTSCPRLPIGATGDSGCASSLCGKLWWAMEFNCTVDTPPGNCCLHVAFRVGALSAIMPVMVNAKNGVRYSL